MRSAILLSLVLLAACASSPAATYERGTLTRPPPPPTRPGVGAPVVGQPGSFTQPPLRSPNKRVLPPSNEPGLWAGDGPRASRRRKPRVTELFGVPLPGHEADATPAEAGLAGVCVSLWNDEVLPRTGLAERVAALKPAERRCMVAWMFHDCTLTILKSDANARAEGLAVMWKRKDREAFARSAVAFTDEACKDVLPAPSQFRLLESLRAALGATYGEPE